MSNVDDFIASEMAAIGGEPSTASSKPSMRPSGMGGSIGKSVTSKPTFGIGGGKKAVGSFAKPTFAMMGGSKKMGAGTVSTGPTLSKGSFNPMSGGPPKITLKKRAQPEDDFIDNEMAQLQQRGGVEEMGALNSQPPEAADNIGSGFNNNRPMHNNIEDSEDPAQDSYASPDRQLPFNNGGMGQEQPRMNRGYGQEDRGMGNSGMVYGQESSDPMRTPASNNRFSGQMESDGVDSAAASASGVTANITTTKKPLFAPKSGAMPLKTVGASKPSMFGSGSKGPTLFKKPAMMGGKKKFQMDVQAPSENELKQIQKVETKLLAPKMVVKLNSNKDSASKFLGLPNAGLNKGSVNQISGASLGGEQRVKDGFVRPMALKERTQMSLANQKANPRPPSSKGRKGANRSTVKKSMLAQNSSGDSYSDENYEEDNFDEADEKDDKKLEQLRKALKRENVTAAKVVTKANIQVLKQDDSSKKVLKMGPAVGKGTVTMDSINREMAQMHPSELIMPQRTVNKEGPLKKLPTLADRNPQFNAGSPQKQQQFSAPPPQMSLEDQKNLKAFAKQAVLKVGPTVDHEAANSQENRTEELKELIGLGQEEFFDIFEMVPRTEQDVYDQKLLAGTHKLALVQTGSEDVEQETQTEELGAHDKWNQAPDDVMIAYKQEDEDVSFVTKKKDRKNDALNLEKFMGRAGPVMEQCVEENNKLRFAQHLDGINKPAAIELKQTLQFPEEILIMLGHEGQMASVLSISAVHMFETAPQSKCAIAYEVMSPRDDLDIVHLIILYSVTANQVLRIMKSEGEVTKMCTPADEQILIVGTDVGSLSLYDLTAFESAGLKQDFFDYEALLMAQHDPATDAGDTNYAKSLKKIRAKYKVLGHTFATDAMEDYKHFSPICQLEFVNKPGSTYAQIGVMDELGVVSQWSVMEIQAHLADKVGDFDLHLNMGGRFKLLENFSESMMFMPEIFENLDGHNDIGQGMELEFDPKDSNIFYFSTSGSLFKCNRKDSLVPTKLMTEGLGAPTALSMSDEGYLLVGFSCGSIAIYHNSYTSPVTLWSNACKLPIVKINWSTVYNNSSNQGADKNTRGTSRFMNRLCEFFVMDTAEDFYIWNIARSMDKPARVISFGSKHDSLGQSKLYSQSMTCADQTFFTGFATTDLSVKLYAMNFRKGSQINRQKVDTENKRSRKLLMQMPLPS